MKLIRTIKKRWYLALIILFVGFLLYQNLVVAPAKKNKENSYQVKRGNLKETVSLSGEIAADQKVTLRFQTSGRLNWVGVKVGDYVKKYQTIASLDQRSVHKTLEKYLRDYAKERLDFDTDKDVNYTVLNDAARRILKKNQYDLDKAVLDVEIQSITIEYANLWTPIEGIVTRVDAPFAGVNITPTQAEFEIVNPSTLYFSATADQNEVIDLKLKDKGEIIFDSYPDDTYKGEINYIAFSPKAGETGTVYEVRLPSPQIPNLRLGMTGDVNFVTKQINNVISVPTNYVNKDSKGEYVYVKPARKKQKKYVQVGNEIDGQIIIKTGISEGEMVYD